MPIGSAPDMFCKQPTVAPSCSICRTRATCSSGSEEISRLSRRVCSSIFSAASSWMASGVWTSSI
ncbi:MAG: hypothetical protein ACXVRX_13400 [Solirubrobacteraceae bacterium]